MVCIPRLGETVSEIPLRPFKGEAADTDLTTLAPRSRRVATPMCRMLRPSTAMLQRRSDTTSRAVGHRCPYPATARRNARTIRIPRPVAGCLGRAHPCPRSRFFRPHPARTSVARPRSPVPVPESARARITRADRPLVPMPNAAANIQIHPVCSFEFLCFLKHVVAGTAIRFSASCVPHEAADERGLVSRRALNRP
jgi:hypothetical protein